MSCPRIPLTRVAGATLLVTALFGCSDVSTGPTARDLTIQETLDVAAVTGDAVVEDIQMMGLHEAALGHGVLVLPRLGRWLESNCRFTASTGRFACPDLRFGPFTIARSFQLLDANGQPQAAYDRLTTASANFVTTVSASISRSQFDATYSRHRDLTVSGLLGGGTTHTFNGTGAGSVSSHHTGGGAARSYSMTSTMMLTNVVVPVPWRVGGWPRSGTITRQVSYSREGARGEGRSGTRVVTITFNGTELVPMTVNGAPFTLDLATGKVVPRG
jgi:hypothetical protein